jgi:hypothetical protein
MGEANLKTEVADNNCECATAACGGVRCRSIHISDRPVPQWSRRQCNAMHGNVLFASYLKPSRIKGPVSVELPYQSTPSPSQPQTLLTYHGSPERIRRCPQCTSLSTSELQDIDADASPIKSKAPHKAKKSHQVAAGIGAYLVLSLPCPTFININMGSVGDKTRCRRPA